MRRARSTTRRVPNGVALAGGLLAAFADVGQPRAADHTDGPQAGGDPAADLGDLYAWRVGENLVVVLTYAPMLEAGESPVFDDDVLYRIHLDTTTDNDFAPTHSIWVRFGQNNSGDWGVRFENVPGAETSFQGPVDNPIYANRDTRGWAGLADDPFFFDQQGWQATVVSATANPNAANLQQFTGADALSGRNVMAIVLEFPLAAIGDPAYFTVWAESGRRP